MVQPKPYDLKGIEAWRTFKRADKAIWSGPNHWTFNLGPLIISLLFLIFCIWFSYFLHSLCNSSFLCIFFLLVLSSLPVFIGLSFSHQPISYIHYRIFATFIAFGLSVINIQRQQRQVHWSGLKERTQNVFQLLRFEMKIKMSIFRHFY